jgi:hypothetical protein
VWRATRPPWGRCRSRCLRPAVPCQGMRREICPRPELRTTRSYPAGACVAARPTQDRGHEPAREDARRYILRAERGHGEARALDGAPARTSGRERVVVRRTRRGCGRAQTARRVGLVSIGRLALRAERLAITGRARGGAEELGGRFTTRRRTQRTVKVTRAE